MYRKGNRKPSRKKYEDNIDFGGGRRPEAEERVYAGLSIKALSNLPHSSYSVVADPYTAGLPASNPYPILNAFNKKIGGTYGGKRNLDGGNVQQYPNSNTSRMLSYFDVFKLKLKMLYNFIPAITPTVEDPDDPHHGEPLDHYQGKALIDEQIKAVSEALSILMSTTFTQMAVNQFVVETDMALGSAEPVTKGTEANPKKVYTDRSVVLYAMSNYYQEVLQEVLNLLRWHNGFRLKQGVMIRNAWDREVGKLNSLFGLFNKKAWLNLVDSLCLLFEGEYVDQEFMHQAGMVNYSPSRRANAITDPVLEIASSFEHPTKFIVYVTDAAGNLIVDEHTESGYKEVFSHLDLFTTVTYLSGGEAVIESIDLWEAIAELTEILSMEDTVHYARGQLLSVDAQGDNNRFNKAIRMLNHIALAFTKFKPRWSDYRQALDTLTRAGICRWTKGYRPAVTQDTDAEMFDNLLIDDIYNLILAGAKNVKFDQDTKRWRSFSLWNMYHGTPEYDAMSGGAFLTFSFKDIEIPTDYDYNIDYVPQLFKLETIAEGDDVLPDVDCVGTNRLGYRVQLTVRDVKMSEVTILNRLVPLDSQSDLEIRVPTVYYTRNVDITQNSLSTLYKTLTQLFGVAAIYDDANDIIDTALDPDILAVYQTEIEDTTNMAITYARNAGPINGTSSPASVIGFGAKSITKSKQGSRV